MIDFLPLSFVSIEKQKLPNYPLNLFQYLMILLTIQLVFVAKYH